MKIELNIVCKSCGGTGIYVGLAERDGMGVVCHTCKGTGCHHFSMEYEEFSERVRRTDIFRVIAINPGIVCGNGQNHQYDLKQFGGMSYIDWFTGKPFPRKSEMREFTCPAWWYQAAEYSKKPEWSDCIPCGAFSECSRFNRKSECWSRWDKEYGDKP